MSLFLVTFFLIYGAFHCYALIKCQPVLPVKGRNLLPVFLFILIMVSMPVLTRILEKSGYEVTAMATAHTGYIWMGFIFFFCSAALPLDALRLVCWLPAKLLRRNSPSVISAQTTFWLPLLLALCACLYGTYEANNIRKQTITVFTDKIPSDHQQLTIVQISDVHLGLIVRQRKLKKIISRVKEAEPDILISTGDLVDGQLAELDGLSDLFRQITPKYGKFAVTGNHEFYAGIRQSSDFTKRSGFHLLQGEAASVSNWLTLIGLDDPVGKKMGLVRKNQEVLLDSTSANRFVILIKHRPTVDPLQLGHFDLQLSGHVHKGQIFPFDLVTRLAYPVPSGLSKLAFGSALYVSRGTGTWGPPFRLLSPPEVTVIKLISAPEKP